MNYTICSSCGQKALSVATRCPRCGLAFEEQFLSRARSSPKSRSMPTRCAHRRHRGGVVRRECTDAAAQHGSAGRGAAPRAGSAGRCRRPPARGRHTADLTSRRTRRERRYASLWTNVRAARSNTAPVLRILRPSEAVQVDSLARGWYRVVSDGLPTGYVDRRLVNDAPTPPSP